MCAVLPSGTKQRGLSDQEDDLNRRVQGDISLLVPWSDSDHTVIQHPG